MLLFIILIHLGGISYAILHQPAPVKNDIIEPTIQGMLVIPEKAPEKIPEKIAPPIPKPKQKQDKPKLKPFPKAPTSERAVKAPEPEPLPVEKPTEEIPIEPESESVVLPSADATELNNKAPVYPGMSKKLKEEGTVLLKILVTKEGRVADIEIKNSSGFKRLDDAAVKAIKRWKFNPATQAGAAIDYWYDIDFEFSLRKK